MNKNSNIHSLHGAYFTATIAFDKVVGRISVNEAGALYLCQDALGVDDDGTCSCRDFFGYKFAWGVGQASDLRACHVFDLKILPPPTEYHAIFQEILEKRGPTWDVDGSYSVIPNEVLSKINDFMEGIRGFDPKNLGNNQNKS